MKVRALNRTEISDALPLIWDVFLECEAVNYPENGKQAFRDAIHSEEYLNMLSAYGAFDGKELIGIIATRNEGAHVALFFVKGVHQGKGIGRNLWNVVLEENASETVTVHSSLYAVPIYEKLGFVQTGDIQEDHGIKYIPMEYKR
ncbi:MAG: GNAT family N-acetyltransferase [Oscillospiraceae bacterium]